MSFLSFLAIFALLKKNVHECSQKRAIFVLSFLALLARNPISENINLNCVKIGIK